MSKFGAAVPVAHVPRHVPVARSLRLVNRFGLYSLLGSTQNGPLNS